MSERNFSRRRRGGMRFRPSGGLGHTPQRPDREASQARAEAVGGSPTDEKVYDNRHRQEIERAENQAAGLPAEGAPTETAEAVPAGKKDFREPNFETPEQVEEQKPFAPVPIQERPKGIVESLRSAANNLVKKVQRLIKP